MTAINSIIIRYMWNCPEIIWKERLEALENYLIRMNHDEETNENL